MLFARVTHSAKTTSVPGAPEVATFRDMMPVRKNLACMVCVCRFRADIFYAHQPFGTRASMRPSRWESSARICARAFSVITLRIADVAFGC